MAKKSATSKLAKILAKQEPSTIQHEIINQVMLNKPYLIIFPRVKDGVETITMHNQSLSLQTLSYMSQFLMSNIQSEIGGKKTNE